MHTFAYACQRGGACQTDRGGILEEHSVLIKKENRDDNENEGTPRAQGDENHWKYKLQKNVRAVVGAICGYPGPAAVWGIPGGGWEKGTGPPAPIKGTI